MTDQPPEVPPPNPPSPAPPGFFAREAQRFLPHAEAEAGRIAADVAAALQDHAGTVFDVAGDGVALLRLIDPGDAALASAAAALLPKLLAMAESAAKVAAAALKAQP